MPHSATETGPTSFDWQNRVSPLSETALNAKIADRVEFLENELSKRGFQLVCGAEQEFTALRKKDGTASTHKIHTEHLHDKLAAAGVRLLECVYKEVGHGHSEPGQYEVVLGTLSNAFFSSHPAVTLAHEIEKLRDALPKLLKSQCTVSFEPTNPGIPGATAGLHTNFSLFDTEGNNLFCHPGNDPENRFSPLAKECGRTLVKVQKEGLAAYGDGKAFYERVAHCWNAPARFGYNKSDGDTSSALRIGQNSTDELMKYSYDEYREPIDPKSTYRLEDRLGAADSNPYLLMLAGVGALYKTLERQTALQKDGFDASKIPMPQEHDKETPIPKNSKNILRNFERSALWWDIAGPQLHQEITQYLRTRQNNLDSGTPS